MKKLLCPIIIGITLIFLITLTGCVAPPAEQKITPVENYDPNQLTSSVTTTSAESAYVTVETPYVTLEPVSASTTTDPLAYRTLPPVTQIQDDYVIIYSFKDQPYSYNKTAVSFDLKNPPMLIDFDVSAANITGERTLTGRTGTDAGKEITAKTDYLDPGAWFEITVREKNLGIIYLKDGFGQEKQYGSDHPRHIKVLKAGNYLIEFGGNKLTANVNLSVKREGNINQTLV
jgi:hypothetical protein